MPDGGLATVNNAVTSTLPHSNSCDCWAGYHRQVTRYPKWHPSSPNVCWQCCEKLVRLIPKDGKLHLGMLGNVWIYACIHICSYVYSNPQPSSGRFSKHLLLQLYSDFNKISASNFKTGYHSTLLSALFPCSHVQVMRLAHLLDGAKLALLLPTTEHENACTHTTQTKSHAGL